MNFVRKALGLLLIVLVLVFFCVFSIYYIGEITERSQLGPLQTSVLATAGACTVYALAEFNKRVKHEWLHFAIASLVVLEILATIHAITGMWPKGHNGWE